MGEIHVLVIFSCETGEVEKLALAAAVGAVQKRASIRLRRILDPSGSRNAEAERMDQDYVAPRAADMAWADGFVLAVDSRALSQLQTLGGFAGKPASLLNFSRNKDGAGEFLLGVHMLSDQNLDGCVGQERARLLGQQVAVTARDRKESNQQPTLDLF